jgi:uncharacterized protein (TIGR02757 family)
VTQVADIDQDEAWLRVMLDEALAKYNTPDFLAEDPISVPHRFSRKEDIEISGLLTAIIAWGNRKTILSSANKMMSLMQESPYEFVMGHSASDLKALKTYVHRTFNGADLVFFVKTLRAIYAQVGGLEVLFTRQVQPSNETISAGIIGLYRTFFPVDSGYPSRARRHLPDIERGSAAKRLNMYLRWMVRVDRAGVDFGLWRGIKPAQLVCPLDVHSGTVARSLGLLHRKQNDWKAALELTERLKQFDPIDPIKYDIALFSIGANARKEVNVFNA